MLLMNQNSYKKLENTVLTITILSGVTTVLTSIVGFCDPAYQS